MNREKSKQRVNDSARLVDNNILGLNTLHGIMFDQTTRLRVCDAYRRQAVTGRRGRFQTIQKQRVVWCLMNIILK